MQRWVATAALGLAGTVALPIHAQAQVAPFVLPQAWFVGPGGVSGVLRGPANHAALGPIGADQIGLDGTGDGLLDSIYDLPADIRNDPQATDRWTLQDLLSPTQRVLYSRRFPTAGSPPVCGGDTANSEVFFHRLGTPPAMTLLGSACLRAPFARQPSFYDSLAPANPRTAIIVGAAQPTATTQPVAWFDLDGGGQGVDGSNYAPNVSVTAEGVQVSPYGNAFFVRHRTQQGALTPRYSIVDLCASRTGGAVTTRDQPAGTSGIAVTHRIENGDLFADVTFSFTGQPSQTETFSLVNCFGGPPPPLRRLTVTVGGSGQVTSSPAGIAFCGVGGPCQADFPDQTPVALTATPLAGATFGGWSGDCSGSQPTAQVPMTADRACSATFLAPQLSISKVADLPAVTPGQTLTYTLAYANSGNRDATGVVVSDTLPASSDFVGAPGGVRAGQTVSWNVGTVAAGASGTVTLQVAPRCQITQVVNNTYSIISAQTPSLPGAAVTTSVGGASTSPVTLQMTSVPARLPLRSGDLITHTLTLTNTGSTNHPSLRMRFGIGDAVALDAIVDSGTGTLTQLNALDLEWAGPLAAGATTSVVFTTIVVDCFTFDTTRFNYGGQPVRVENYCGQAMAMASPPGAFALQRNVQAELTMVSPARNLVRPGETVDMRIALTNNLSADQPNVSIALPLPPTLIVGNPPFVSPTDTGAQWDDAARTVSWSGTLAGTRTVTITVRAVVADPAPCRIVLDLGGMADGCHNLARGLRLSVVPASPSGPHLVALDLRDGLFLWEPGVDRNFRELLCYQGAEGFQGFGRSPGGDVWIAGLPTLRANVDRPELEIVDHTLFGSAGPADLGHDPTSDTLVSVGGEGGFRRYDPRTGQVSLVAGPLFFQRVLVEPDGTIVAANSRGVYRTDPANPGSPQAFEDPTYNQIFALARDTDGDYLITARRVTGAEDLVEIDRSTGTFTPIISGLAAVTGSSSNQLAVGADGAIYLGRRDGADLYRVDRSGPAPVVTALSTIGSRTNPSTPGVSANSIQDLLFVGPAAPPAPADVAVAKTADAGTVAAGAVLNYRVTVTNLGPGPATGVRLVDSMPPGVVLGAVVASQGTCSGPDVVCDLGVLPAGGQATVTIAATVPSSAPAGSTLTNRASASAATTDPVSDNDTASVTTEVVAATDGENMDPAGTGEQFAHGENVGWLNLEPLGDGGPGVEVRDDGLTGWMWGESVGWCSLSCATTGSCGTAAYGVTNDGAGRLGGWAWCENTGWLSFSCENTAGCGSTRYGVEIAPDTGVFSGNAWGENAGWITFGLDGPVPYRIVTGWRGGRAVARPR